MRLTAPPLAGLTALIAALVMLAGAPGARAEDENTVYRTLPVPRATQSPGKIEVLEFFSYACPHCAEFYPLVTGWLATQGKDVAFKRVPVGFDRAPWINMQRAYYALIATGDFDRLDAKVFQAIHGEHIPLFQEQALFDWVAKNGGNYEKFTAAYGSFGVNNQTVQADKMAEDYQITGVPTIAIDGRYVVLGDSFTQILANADKVIAKVRAERTAAAPRKKPGT